MAVLKRNNNKRITKFPQTVGRHVDKMGWFKSARDLPAPSHAVDQGARQSVSTKEERKKF